MPSLSLGQRMDGALNFATALAAKFDSENDALPYGRSMAQAVKNHWVYGSDLVASDLYWTNVRTLGDISIAWSVDFESESSEWILGFVLTRQGREFQLLYGTVDIGSPVTKLADTAEHSVERWPDTPPITIGDDGIKTGGLWSALPMLTDIPEGMYFDEELKVNL